MLSVQEASLNWALEHCLVHGDTDVFPLPFEYLAIQHDWDNVREYLAAANLLDWVVRPHRTLLSPKAKYGFRAITQLDPLDNLMFGAVIREIADDLESRRIPTDQNRVFSYRVDINAAGQLFDPSVGYRQFLDECRRKLQSDESFSVVATTDISDFYSRIYLHRLENALRNACGSASHVSAVMKLLSGWNGTESFGLPVGGAYSTILAEITISDIDEALLANGVEFIRFNDDYRIFAHSTSEAYQHLAFLAETLFRNHGLSLQPQKTRIYSRSEFFDVFLSTPLDREMNSLRDRFEHLLRELGLGNRYEPIEYDDLTEEQQGAVDALNLVELFREEVAGDEPEMPIVKFVLRRLGQLGDDSIVEDVFGALEKIYPAFVDVVEYMSKLRHLNADQKSALGNRLLDLLDNTIVSELMYHRMWILNMFTHSREWDNEQRFFTLYGAEPEQVCRRKLILAMGRAQQRHWFQSQWRTLLDHPSWSRRAVLAGASCMPPDARRHWYRSVEAQLDVLEKAVMRWAKANPFSE